LLFQCELYSIVHKSAFSGGSQANITFRFFISGGPG
jgi:hypothetical protein